MISDCVICSASYCVGPIKNGERHLAELNKIPNLPKSAMEELERCSKDFVCMKRVSYASNPLQDFNNIEIVKAHGGPWEVVPGQIHKNDEVRIQILKRVHAGFIWLLTCRIVRMVTWTLVQKNSQAVKSGVATTKQGVNRTHGSRRLGKSRTLNASRREMAMNMSCQPLKSWGQVALVIHSTQFTWS